MRYRDKIDRLLGASSGSAAGPAIEATEVAPNEISTLGHRCANPKTARYLFEPETRVLSPWISYNRGPNPANFIGAYSYINNGGYLRDRILIGRYCSIGRRTTIGAGMHPMERLSTSRFLKGGGRPYSADESRHLRRDGTAPRMPTVIGCDVWIGDGAVVMPGIEIATGSIIGANAVVTRNTEPYGIYAGLPARRISDRFSPALAERLLATEWWEYDPETLNTLPTRNVFEFLDAIEGGPPPAVHFATYRISPH